MHSLLPTTRKLGSWAPPPWQQECLQVKRVRHSREEEQLQRVEQRRFVHGIACLEVQRSSQCKPVACTSPKNGMPFILFVNHESCLTCTAIARQASLIWPYLCYQSQAPSCNADVGNKYPAHHSINLIDSISVGRMNRSSNSMMSSTL